MRRGDFLRSLLVAPAALVSAPGAGERNVLELTTEEFFARLPCGLVGCGTDRHTERAVVMASLARATRPDVEVFENDTRCGACGNASYRYRWRTRFLGAANTTTDWYCVCGYVVGYVRPACTTCNNTGHVLVAPEALNRKGWTRIGSGGYLPDHTYTEPVVLRVPCPGCAPWDEVLRHTALYVPGTTRAEMAANAGYFTSLEG
jgi:hypothetical protein